MRKPLASATMNLYGCSRTTPRSSPGHRVSPRTNQGAVYMTYQWWIGACNELVGEVLSPITKTPEYKYVPVRVEK